jgi:N-acetylglucosaminyldiphosphoundecaprenol N-acetyl-beta-D-mannosaminyltransferase
MKAATLTGIRLFHEKRKPWLAMLTAQLNATNGIVLMHTINLEIFAKGLEDASYQKVLQNADWSVVDGYPVSFFAFLKRGVFLRRICGSDFIYDLIAVCEKEGKKILLMGGTGERVELAVRKAKEKHPKLSVLGYSPAFPCPLSVDDDPTLKALIESERPSAIAVCLGAPKQELWMETNREFLAQNGVRLAIGLGGVVDFLSGEIRRAPWAFRRFGMEWLWRCILEPHRVKRYVGAGLSIGRYVLGGRK